MMCSIRPLSPELQEKSERELNEVPSRVADDIKHIKEWLAQQPHMNARTDDQWILSFLRGCKFSLERTKQKLDLYYTLRTLMPQYYRNRNPFLPQIQEMLKLGLVLPLTKTAENARPKIILLSLGNIDEKYELEEVTKVVLMIVDILLWEDDNFIICGQHAILDCKGVRLNLASGINLANLKKLEMLLEKGYPSRPQAFTILNAPPFIELFFNIVKPLISKKNVERVRLFSGENFEDPSIMQIRKEYECDSDALNDLRIYWKRKVESYAEWYLEDENFLSDESKRIGTPKTIEDIFGADGSFRHLEVD